MTSKIEEYCNLTGRPIATITVDEFISFDKAYGNGGVTAVISPTTALAKEDQAEHRHTERTNLQPVPTNIKQEQKKKAVEPTNDALKMLQSVSG